MAGHDADRTEPHRIAVDLTHAEAGELIVLINAQQHVVFRQIVLHTDQQVALPAAAEFHLGKFKQVDAIFPAERNEPETSGFGFRLAGQRRFIELVTMQILAHRVTFLAALIAHCIKEGGRFRIVLLVDAREEIIRAVRGDRDVFSAARLHVGFGSFD